MSDLDLDDDVTGTQRLRPPTEEEMPLQVLANTNAIRTISSELRSARRAFYTMAAALATFVGAHGYGWIESAQERGAEQARVVQMAADIDRNDARIARLEQKAMQITRDRAGDDDDGR